MPIDLTKPYTAEDFGNLFTGPGISQQILTGQPVQIPVPQTPVTRPNQPIFTPAGLPQPPIISNNVVEKLSGPPPANQLDEDILTQFKPDTRAQDEYFKLLQTPPKREEPGLGRRIVAGLGTFSRKHGSLEEAERYKYEPYYREREEHDRKAGILKELATNERAANVNERQILSTMLTDRQRTRQLEETNRKNLAAEQNARDLNKIRAFVAQNGDYRETYKEDGTILLQNRKTGQIYDTGIKGQPMSEFDKLLATITGQAARDALNNQADMERDAARFQHETSLAELQSRLRKAEAEAKAGTMSPSELQQHRYNVASRMFNEGIPDHLPAKEAQEFIRLGDPNVKDFRLVLPEKRWMQSNAEHQLQLDKYSQIAMAIYGANWRAEYPDLANAIAAARVGGAPPTAPSQRSKGPGREPVVTNAPPKQPRMTKRQVNQTTGQTREMESLDGGKTWKPTGRP